MILLTCPQAVDQHRGNSEAANALFIIKGHFRQRILGSGWFRWEFRMLELYTEAHPGLTATPIDKRSEIAQIYFVGAEEQRNCGRGQN